MDNGGIWPGDESYFQNIRETALQDTIEQLTKELAEARAEIENLKWHISSEKAKAEAALALNDRALGLVNEARTDAEHWKSECNALQRMAHEARARIDHPERIIDEMTEEQAALCAEGQSITELVAAKDKLIEQMREALKAIDGIGREAGNARREDALRCFAIAAAALAAERGV